MPVSSSDSATLSNAPLWRLAWRRMRRRPFQYVLFILGIAIGVAMMVSIDLANGSAQRAFALSTDAIAGRTTHRIEAISPIGIDESLYRKLRTELGYTQSAPIVEGYVVAEDLDRQPMRLVGVDFFAEAPFRSYLNDGSNENSDQGVEALTTFLTEPGAVILARDTAADYGVQVGDRLTLTLAGQPVSAHVVGILQPANTLTRDALSNVLFTDIASAQEILGMQGYLSHIDLIADSDAALEPIRALLPTGVKLETAQAQKNAVQQMTAAFELNLTALSLLALVVGMFLIYNTVTFSVIQRRPLFGTLRCLGVTQGQLFQLILGESLLLSIVGSILGLGLGVILGRSIVGLITQSINDFYFVVYVRDISLSSFTLIKGMVIGIFAALFASLIPALEAMGTSPNNSLKRSTLESKVQQILPWLVLAWGLFTLGGVGLLSIKNGGLVIAFGGLFAILLAAALLTPPLTALLMQWLSQLLTGLLGVLGKMAPRDITRSLSRTSVAIASLMVAVSVIVGVSVMVGSFRTTVVQWLDQTLQADIYVTPPSTTANRILGSVDPSVVDETYTWPEIDHIVTYNDTDVDVIAFNRQGTDATNATEISVNRSAKLISADGDVSDGQRPYAWIRDNVQNPWPQLDAGEGVIISEALMLRAGVSEPPETITLESPQGPITLPVVAVFYDYASDRGTILLDNDRYLEVWQDPTIASLGLFLRPGISADSVVTHLRETFKDRQDLVAQSNRNLRQGSLEIFDRTFAITGALRLLAIVVAFIGVLSALMSLQLERTKELGILRANGMTPLQMWQITLLETGIMGSLAGVFAMPLGYVLAWILIYVINVRSFGWTLQMQIEPSYFWQAWVVAVVAALLAGVYPAWRLSKMVVATAIREE
ncbi:adhesion component transport transmembrane protein abc transporter [Leptolyngbya sp. Heron Island J]|uniref:FtsX-like permease family protein n=1 Tax=Leptolyngbya sp. Heron Island J TaxID=1385935 RepID=UPI0003B99454|nr:ABC transporter permease [Leptolyngbya sp. Heron Island J]ESA33182.1 adhesion component transport transmembrane protein abc transporter [Leptolyngbya sp. Heron Island J]